jgi:hypothetical protein
MASAETGEFRRKAGRKEKPLPDDGEPRTILAAQLRELKNACGGPTFKELARLSDVYQTGLQDAASATKKLPGWYVVKGYVEGCWKYHEVRFRTPCADAGDLSRWQQLYRDAGGTMPDEYPLPTPEHDEQPEPQPVLSDVDEPAGLASLPPLTALRSSPASGPPPVSGSPPVSEPLLAARSPASLLPRLIRRPVPGRARLVIGLLCLAVPVCLAFLAWPVSSSPRPVTSPPAAWCAYVTALPAPVLSAPSPGATLVKLKDLGNGIEILPLPHPPGWWPVYTPRNRPYRNWMPAAVLSQRAAGTRPCPDSNSLVAVTAYNSDSAEEQFAVGSDCRVYHRWQTEAGGQFSRWSSMGGCASGHHGLAVGMNGDGELVAFVISPDHTVWYKSQSKPGLGPWTGWTSIGGDAYSGLRVISAPSGSSPIQVFADDKSGGIWENAQTQETGNCCWSGWIQTPGPDS